MFTLNDIRNIAIQIEHNGEKTYRSAGKNADDPQIAYLLNWMADEERRHAQWFEALQVSSQEPLEHDEVESMGQSLLRDMMKNQTFSLDDAQLTSVADISGLLELSLEFEQDTILFYEMLRAFIEAAESSDQLNRIIEEERGHVQQIQRLQAIYAGKRKQDNSKQ